jgi:hypothetical protein
MGGNRLDSAVGASWDGIVKTECLYIEMNQATGFTPRDDIDEQSPMSHQARSTRMCLMKNLSKLSCTMKSSNIL